MGHRAVDHRLGELQRWQSYALGAVLRDLVFDDKVLFGVSYQGI